MAGSVLINDANLTVPAPAAGGRVNIAGAWFAVRGSELSYPAWVVDEQTDTWKPVLGLLHIGADGTWVL